MDEKSMASFVYIDDLYMAGDKYIESKILANIRKDFSVGSEDKDDILFVGQRVKWDRISV